MVDQVIPGISRAALRTQEPPISWLMQAAVEAPGLISLAAGLVDRASLPLDLVTPIMHDLIADVEAGRDALQYGTTPGLAGLRAAVAERYAAGTAYGDADQVLITTGSQQFLQLVSEALLDEGDVVIVEQPSYFVYLGLLASAGVDVRGVATDAEGLCIEDLERVLDELGQQGRLPRLKLIYLVSYHQNPSGRTLSLSRRQRLLEVVGELPPSCRILEDAAYYELSFEPERRPPLLARLDDSGRRVITALTTSKGFAPGLKTGFGLLPRELVELCIWLKGNHDFGSGNLAQHVLLRALQGGAFEAQIDRNRAVYRQKAAVLDAALRQTLPPGAAVWQPADGGLYLWLQLPNTATDLGSAFFEACQAEGVLYVPGSFAFASGPQPTPGDRLRLTYGVVDEDELREGAARLGRAWRRVQEERR